MTIDQTNGLSKFNPSAELEVETLEVPNTTTGGTFYPGT